MIFLGDLSVPNRQCAELLIHDMDKSGLFRDETVVVNLEGVLQKDGQVDSFWKVYNHQAVIGMKEVCGKLIFSLANNHTYDYPENIDFTTQLLVANEISCFGLKNKDGVSPLCFKENGVKYAIFGHCWSVYTHTNKNLKTQHRIEDCTYQEFYNCVTEYITKHRDEKIICFLHWNFDMEQLPFPAYKQLAHELIDFGVEAVIGNHAHVVQDVEMYRGKVIAYGLGNFYMPDGYFFNGNLKYPPQSHQCIGIQIFQDDRNPVMHRFISDPDGKTALQYVNDKQIIGGGE